MFIQPLDKIVTIHGNGIKNYLEQKGFIQKKSEKNNDLYKY